MTQSAQVGDKLNASSLTPNFPAEAAAGDGAILHVLLGPGLLFHSWCLLRVDDALDDLFQLVQPMDAILRLVMVSHVPACLGLPHLLCWLLSVTSNVGRETFLLRWARRKTPR